MLDEENLYVVDDKIEMTADDTAINYNSPANNRDEEIIEEIHE